MDLFGSKQPQCHNHLRPSTVDVELSPAFTYTALSSSCLCMFICLFWVLILSMTSFETDV